MSGVRAASKLSLPGPFKVIGKKQLEIASQWVGSAMVFGATAAATVCYFTDWRVVVENIPYYNGKFKTE